MGDFLLVGTCGVALGLDWRVKEERLISTNCDVTRVRTSERGRYLGHLYLFTYILFSSIYYLMFVVLLL